MRWAQPYYKNTKEQIKKICQKYKELFDEHNYKAALEKIEEYLTYKNFLHKRSNNEPFIISAYFTKIACIIKTSNEDANMDSVFGSLKLAWEEDSSLNKKEFKKVCHYFHKLFQQHETEDDIILCLLYAYFPYNYSSYKDYKAVLHKNILENSKPEVIQFAYKALFHYEDIFHFIPLASCFYEYYKRNEEFDKIIPMAEAYGRLLDYLKSPEFKILYEDIEKIFVTNWQLHSTQHYLWLYSTYLQLGQYDKAQVILEQNQNHINQKSREEKWKKLCMVFQKANMANKGKLLLLQHNLDEASKMFDQLLELNRDTYDLVKNYALKTALTSKICLLLYQNKITEANNIAKRYLTRVHSVGTRKAFLEDVEQICNLFAKNSIKNEERMRFQQNLQNFLNNYSSTLLDSTLLLATAQIGLWTSVMLHELKNNLGGFSQRIPMALEFLQNNSLEEVRYQLLELQRIYNKVHSLVQGFHTRLNLSYKIDLAPIAGNYFNDIFEKLSLTYLTSKSKIEFKLDNQLDANFVFISEIFYIEHVLMNLLRNSIEAIKEKEKDTSITGYKGIVVLRIEFLKEEETIKFTVSDNGPGFSKQPQRFDSAKEGEMRGLGIYVSRMLIKTLGGHLVTSPVGREGADVYFTIPASCKGVNDGD